MGLINQGTSGGVATGESVEEEHENKELQIRESSGRWSSISEKSGSSNVQ